MLVLTRASQEDGLHDLVCSLIYWPLFEVPGLDLEKIHIPIMSLPGGMLPEQEQLEDLISIILDNINKLGNAISSDLYERATSDLNRMKFSPGKVLEALDKQRNNDDACLSLLDRGHGTQFIIRPYDTVLDDDLASESKDKISVLEKLLIGFSNTMFADIEPPPIKAAFRQHQPDGEIRDFIGERSFFTPDEYRTADHIIEGKFDEYGQFQGKVKIFDQTLIPYTLNWSGAKGAQTLCGPFEIRFGYIQGDAHRSLLPAEEWTRFTKKLDRMGGLYIYRDGIRILPYGDTDKDFLNIERRRTLSAQDWFFSYRRIFGAILISSEQNRQLQEKAGREGFRETMSYRQFRDILENFFMFLAKDFFRENAPLGEEFNRMKEELDARNKLLKKRDKLIGTRKEKFRKALDDFFSLVERAEPSIETERLKAKFNQQFNAISMLSDPDQIGEQLYRIENEIRGSLEDLRQRYRVSRPQGIGLTKQMTSDWQAYKKVYVDLEETQFSPLASLFDQELALLIEHKGKALNRRLMLRQALENRQQSIKKIAAKGEKEAREGLNRARDSIRRGINDSINRLRNEIEAVLSDFERTEVANLDGEATVSLRVLFERRLDSASERETNFLEGVKAQNGRPV